MLSRPPEPPKTARNQVNSYTAVSETSPLCCAKDSQHREAEALAFAELVLHAAPPEDNFQPTERVATLEQRMRP